MTTYAPGDPVLIHSWGGRTFNPPIPAIVDIALSSRSAYIIIDSGTVGEHRFWACTQDEIRPNTPTPSLHGDWS